MTEKYVARWKALRNGGRKQFIWKRCVLSFMLPFTSCVAILNQVHHPSFGIGERILLAVIPVAIATLAVGYPFGCIIWSIMERKYLRIQKELEVSAKLESLQDQIESYKGTQAHDFPTKHWSG